MRGFFFVLLLCGAALGFGQLTPRERQGIADAMLIGNIAPADYVKPSLRPASMYCLPVADVAITKPLQGIEDLLSLHAKANSLTATGLLEAARHDVFGDTLSPDATAQTKPVTLPDTVPPGLKGPIGDLVAAVQEANGSIRGALSKLNATERRTLIDSLPQFATQEPSIKFAFVKQPMASPATILALLDKVDLQAIRLASVKLTSVIQATVPKLKEAAKTTTLPTTQTFAASGVTVELSGTGDDIHATSNSMLCVDLGGHNLYKGRYAAGIGYASVLVDLGDSDFDVPDLSLGAGLMGIGIAYVGRANDDFRGQSLCFGAGLAGVGVFMKEAGSDTYRASSLCEGFGMFGIGLMIDNGTDKRYEAVAFGQGASRTQGFGWLINRASHASFSSTGVRGRSCSQGYGAGYPAVEGGLAGGLGLITQVGGQADYQAARQAQAYGAWEGVGSICDSSGHSSLKVDAEGQGFAAVSGGAYLYELGAGNTLVCSSAGCHGVASADGSAVLLARGGGDVFAAGEERAGSGIGILLESGPDNRYLGAPGRQSGLFVDLGGSSRYASGISDAEAFGSHSSVAFAAEGEAQPPTPSKLKPGSAVRPPDSQLQVLYVSAVDGSDSQALGRLIEIGKPALDWMLNNKLKDATTPGRMVMSAVAQAIGDDAGLMLTPRIGSSNDSEASNALEIAVIANLQIVKSSVAAALARPGLERVAAQAAGQFGLADLTPILMGLTLRPDVQTAVNATNALAEIGDPKTVSTGQALLGSPNAKIRQAAEDLVAKFPDRALDAAKSLFEHPEELSQRTAIELLGKVGTEAALEMVGPLLDSPNPGIRIQALLSLDGKCPMSYRVAMLSLRRDKDSRVRAVANHVDPGR